MQVRFTESEIKEKLFGEKMKKRTFFIRAILRLALIYIIFVEAGIFTAIFALCVSIYIEVINARQDKETEILVRLVNAVDKLLKKN